MYKNLCLECKKDRLKCKCHTGFTDADIADIKAEMLEEYHKRNNDSKVECRKMMEDFWGPFYKEWE